MIELFGYAFFRTALLASVLAGAACALVGVWILTLRISLVGVCISHAAFAGALLALLFGWPTLPLSLVFGLGAAGAMGPLADRGRFSPDTAVGLLFSSTLGLAFLLMGILPEGRAAALDLLWGSVLTVGPADLAVLAVALGLTLAAILAFFREIQAVLFNRDLARAAGLRATWFYYLVICLVGLVITAGLKSVGGLLVFSLAVNPAAAAWQLTYNFGRTYLLAAGFGIASAVLGLLVSAWLDLPSGATVVLVSSAIFGLALLFSPKRARRRRPAAGTAGDG